MMHKCASSRYPGDVIQRASSGHGALTLRASPNPVRQCSNPSVQNHPRQVQMAHFSSTEIAARADSQKPKVDGDPTDQKSYVLTLHTSNRHHKSMDGLRQSYFPPNLNKIPAHITLFHALPGSKLKSDVLPAITVIAAKTPPYKVRASHPFRMAHGVGIHVDDDIDHASDTRRGRNMTRQIHAALRRKWADWLSDQDSSPVKMHYTVMNKIEDDALIRKAMEQLKQSFDKGEDVSGGNFQGEGKRVANEHNNTQGGKHNDKLHLEGNVQGLTLWTYHHSGHWMDPEHFKFEGKDR